VKTYWLGLFSAIVILPLAVGVFFRLGLGDIQADAAPPAWESRVMTAAVHRSVDKRTGDLPAVSAADEDSLVRGGKLYMLGCAGCHGELGKPIKEDLAAYPRIPQLPGKGTQYSQPQIYWIVKRGIRMTAMSAYGRFYSEQDLWSIVAFLHQIKNLPPTTESKILAITNGAAH